MEITVTKLNEATLRVTSDDFGIEQELCEFFSFYVPGYQFMPKFRAKVWDGKAKLYDVYRKTLPAGLLTYLKVFAKDNEYPLNIAQGVEPPRISFDAKAYMDALDIHSKGRKIELRDYQYEAVKTGVEDERALLLSPTSSGKSAIIYCYIRHHLEQGHRVIIMVPTVGLVTQMLDDFKDYSSENGWDTEAHCHGLYSGQPKTFGKPVLITTWQSIHAYSKGKTKDVTDFFKLWDVFIGDEAHLFASNKIQELSLKLVKARNRLGTTGTINNDKVSKLTLEGTFGPVVQVTTTKELMERGQVVNLKIKCLCLQYPEEKRKLLKKAEYQQEMDYIVGLRERNRFIVNLAKATKGNTLVLFNLVQKHGKPMFEMAREMMPDRPLFYISGEVDVEVREKIRRVLDSHEDAIVFASYATTSTGINIPSIENIIFSSPFKARIRGLQSIGRGLRLRDGKESCLLVDVSDDLSHKSHQNHTLRHFKERLQTYQDEGFEFTITNVPFNIT